MGGHGRLTVILCSALSAHTSYGPLRVTSTWLWLIRLGASKATDPRVRTIWVAAGMEEVDFLRTRKLPPYCCQTGILGMTVTVRPQEHCSEGGWRSRMPVCGLSQGSMDGAVEGRIVLDEVG